MNAARILRTRTLQALAATTWLPFFTLCFFTLCLFTVRPVLSETFFFEDFDNPDWLDEFGFPSDVFLQDEGGWSIVDEETPAENATWTLTNPGGRLSPAGERGFPSEGFFLISDSDSAGGANPPGSGMSHDVWSPSIDCSAAETVWLHLSCVAQLNNNGEAVFDIDVTTDEGETWTNVFRRIAPARSVEPLPTNDNADGWFGRLHVDLSEVAAGNEIRIRWRHFEPNDDWWISIDDVLVDDEPGPEAGPVTLLAEESFSAGIPASWELRSLAEPPNEGAETWSTEDKGGRYTPGAVGQTAVNRLQHPEPGAAFAIIDSDADPDPAEDEYLVTPTIDCSCADSVIISFKSEILATGALQEVLVSVDGGVDFEPIPVFSYNLGAGFDAGEDPFYAERVIEVPVAAQEDQVAFAFHYQSAGNEWWWAIDDVSVTAVDSNGDCDLITCANRSLRTAGFDGDTNSVTVQWSVIDGDTRHELRANGELLAGDLAGDVSSFVHSDPPRTETVVYELVSFAGATERTRCESDPIAARLCPSGLSCCYDRDTDATTLTWNGAVNLPGSGLEILRDGQRVATLALDAATWIDESLPGPGDFQYEIVLAGAPASICPDLPLACSVHVAGDDVLFFDDFNCYGSDIEVRAAGWEFVEVNEPLENSAWTVTNPGSRAQPPTEDGSPSTGGFLISDSDFGGLAASNPPGSGMSHDLWSPPIDCSRVDTVWVHFDLSAQLNDNGEAVFDVDVSTDGGENFTNAFRRIAPSRSAEPLPTADAVDGFFGRLHLDLTAQAAGESDVLIRLRHFEPNWDWWIAIDNFQVDSTPNAPGSVELLETETFEDGIQDDWLVETPDPFGQWATGDACFLLGGGATQLHHFADTFYAGVCGQAIDELLATPPIDCSDLSEVWLSVKSAIHMGGPLAEILLSLDGGDTFLPDPIFRYDLRSLHDGFEDPFYGEYVFRVPAAAGEGDVVFGFHYQIFAELQGWWAIDDVSVTGTAGGAESIFARGDADADSNVGINDGIVILNWLFLGGQEPNCLDAADSDDSGTVVLNDAVTIFNWLFTGGAAPAPPSPTTGSYPPADCGADPTADALDCGNLAETCS